MGKAKPKGSAKPRPSDPSPAKASKDPGTTADPAVTMIASNGIALLLDGLDYFLLFDEFPWFQNAAPEAVRVVTRPEPGLLRWPQLDVDLPVDAIGEPVVMRPAAPTVPAGAPAKKPATKKPAAKKPAAKAKKPVRR